MVASIVDVFQVLKDDTETGYVSGTFSFMLLSVCCAHQDDVFVFSKNGSQRGFQPKHPVEKLFSRTRFSLAICRSIHLEKWKIVGTSEMFQIPL